MTSASSFPLRLTKIDDLARPDHFYLTAADDCYCLGEYTARKGFAFSATNRLILNFKKTMDRRGRSEWVWKDRALQQAAAAFRAALNSDYLDVATLVPVPPSKARTDPLYDDRMTRMLRAIRPQPPLDVREIILQTHSSDPVHDQAVRPRPDEIVARYQIDPNLLPPPPRAIAICDDVLTTGAHYRAAHTVLQQAFPGVRLIGLFIARRVPEAVDFSDFDELP
jgi:predicted amidophosphoribosyltransferase